jgi:plastocyanin
LIKKVLILSAMVACVIALGALLMAGTDVSQEIEALPEGDYEVLIAMTSSRPGCEETNSCYIPHTLVVERGQTVVWINEDRGFHTVTAGYYDVPEEPFDSGQMRPSDKFHHTFDEKGTFDYYCRLHPWMVGTIVVN